MFAAVHHPVREVMLMRWRSGCDQKHVVIKILHFSVTNARSMGLPHPRRCPLPDPSATTHTTLTKPMVQNMLQPT